MAKYFLKEAWYSLLSLSKTKGYFEDNLYQMPSVGPDIALLKMDKPVPNEAKFCSICLPASNNFPDTPLHGEVFCFFSIGVL